MNEQIHSLGYLSWVDPLKWMEDMKGSAWNSAVKTQQDQYQRFVKQQGAVPQMLAKELEETGRFLPESQVDDILYRRVGKFTYRLHFEGANAAIYCADFDTKSCKKLWTVQDTSSGDESYTLRHRVGSKPIWTYEPSVGPFVAIVGSHVYCLESENSLWYCRLVRLNADTGGQRQVLLEMKDPLWNLELIKGEAGCLFLRANNAGDQRLWFLDRTSKLQELTRDHKGFVPVGYLNGTATDPCYFARRGRIYEAVGSAFKGFRLPSFHEETPEWGCLHEGVLVTRRYGVRTLWSIYTGRIQQRMVGQFQPNEMTYWKHGQTQMILVRPNYEMLPYGAQGTPYAHTSYHFARSADGTRVPYCTVHTGRVRALLVVAYGAYGLPTHLSTERWKPLLKRGWAICLAFVRGGGDHDDAWAEAARRDQKGKSVEDLEACVRAARGKYHLPATKTAIYGRSAGGYLVGSALARNANGQLFGCVYTEVPYVDVLSTTSNPSLPLTKMEYNEFGDPLHRPQDARALMDLSPIDSLPSDGAPSVFVLARTGLHDKEVFAYEPMKWITKLQSLQSAVAAPKLLAINKKQGHFAWGSQASLERASDLSLLLDWAGIKHASWTTQ